MSMNWQKIMLIVFTILIVTGINGQAFGTEDYFFSYKLNGDIRFAYDTDDKGIDSTGHNSYELGKELAFQIPYKYLRLRSQLGIFYINEAPYMPVRETAQFYFGLGMGMKVGQTGLLVTADVQTTSELVDTTGLTKNGGLPVILGLSYNKNNIQLTEEMIINYNYKYFRDRLSIVSKLNEKRVFLGGVFDVGLGGSLTFTNWYELEEQSWDLDFMAYLLSRDFYKLSFSAGYSSPKGITLRTTIELRDLLDR